jgi:hypothetical protein
MKTLITCDGICIGDAFIPPFEVFTAEYVGLANPTDYGVQWNDLMQALGGLCPTAEVHIAGRSAVITPPGFQPLEQAVELQMIIDVAVARGLPRASAERIIIDLGLEEDHAYGDIQLTPRLLLDLRLAWSQGAELVVFSTAGLDPSGVLAVADEVSKMLGQCSAIHVFSTPLTQHYQSLCSFSKVVRCCLVERD